MARLPPPPLGNTPGTDLLQRLIRPEGQTAAGMNRTRDLPACSAVPQPTAPPRARFFQHTMTRIFILFRSEKNGLRVRSIPRRTVLPRHVQPTR